MGGMSDTPWINIESTDGMGHASRVTTQDGVEIKYVTGVDVSIRVGEPNKATLHVLAVRGEINAEVEAIKERLVPDPRSVLVVKVGEAQLFPDTPALGETVGGRQRITIVRLTNRGVDHTETTTMCEGWVSACEPFELTVPEEEE